MVVSAHCRVTHGPHEKGGETLLESATSFETLPKDMSGTTTSPTTTPRTC